MMPARYITLRAVSAALLIACASSAFADTPASQATPAAGASVSPNAAIVSVEAKGKPLADVARDLSQQAGVPIWVEPGLSMEVNASLSPRPLDEALSLILGEHGPVWARVDVVPQKDANGSQTPPPGVFDLVRALALLPADRVSVQMAGGQPAVVDRKAPQSAPAQPQPNQPAPISAYVIARKSATASSSGATTGSAGLSTQQNGSRIQTPAVAKYTDLSRSRFDLLQGMSQAERQEAIRNDLMLMLQLPPEARAQMRQDQRAAWQSLPPDLVQQFRQQMQAYWQQNGGGPWRGRRGGPGGPPPASQ